MAQAASKTCEICIAAPGLHYCSQCDQLFCDGCKKSHLRAKISKDHTFLSGPNINPEEKIQCRDHCENFMFDCVQCRTPVCQVCVVTTHSGHKLVGIKDSMASLRSELATAIGTKLNTFKSDAGNIGKEINKYEGDISKAIETIKNESKAIKDMIDKKVEAIITTLNEKRSENLKKLTKVKQDVNINIDKLQKHAKTLKDIQQFMGEAAVLKNLKSLKEDLSRIESTKMPQFPTVTYTKISAKDSEIDKLFGSLSFQDFIATTTLTETKPQKTREEPRKICRYKCVWCGTKQVSELEPTERWSWRTLHCGKCGDVTFHKLV